jgi:trehalose/maltose hydrolase-like predicted phosphorylase
MSEWQLIYRGFEPGQEGLREALCTLGNGDFATRGAAEEAEADDVHYRAPTSPAGTTDRQRRAGDRDRRPRQHAELAVPELPSGRRSLVQPEALRLNPCVPPELQRLRLRARYRGQWLELEISCEAMTVRTPPGWTGPNRIAIHDEVREFQPGEMLRFTCRPSQEQALPRTLAETSAG